MLLYNACCDKSFSQHTQSTYSTMSNVACCAYSMDNTRLGKELCLCRCGASERMDRKQKLQEWHSKHRTHYPDYMQSPQLSAALFCLVRALPLDQAMHMTAACTLRPTSRICLPLFIHLLTNDSAWGYTCILLNTPLGRQMLHQDEMQQHDLAILQHCSCFIFCSLGKTWYQCGPVRAMQPTV